MSIRIDYEWNGEYRIRLSGDRTRIYAKNEREVGAAVRHYAGKCARTLATRRRCPLCRLVHARVTGPCRGSGTRVRGAAGAII
jgi:hypothetical protein